MKNRTGNQPKTGRNISIRTYLVATLVALLIVAVGDFIPQLIGNENVYLVSSRRFVEPTFLQNDWSINEIYSSGFHPFRVVMAPLWAISTDPVVVAMSGRMLLWIPLLISMMALGTAIGLRPVYIVVGIGMFVLSRQGLVAGEWIIGGVEQKMIAYMFLF